MAVPPTAVPVVPAPTAAKADLAKRFIGVLIDCIIVGVAGMIIGFIPFIGGLLANA